MKNDNVFDKLKKIGKNKIKINNKEYIFVMYIFVFLFLSLILYIAYYKQIKGEEIINNQYNIHNKNYNGNVIKGKIFSRDGKVLAKTVLKDGKLKRYYPYGDLFFHVVGFDSITKSGLEYSFDFKLHDTDIFFFKKFENIIYNKKSFGNNIYTTLDIELQKIIKKAFGKNKGAAIVMDANNGDVLAMYSNPNYDPNLLVDNYSKVNLDSKEGELLNRATQGLYSPGSIFKIITALEFMRENDDYELYKYKCKGKIKYYNKYINCYNKHVHGIQNLKKSFANSCNSSFANIANSLDVDMWNDTCSDLLFNKDLHFFLNSATSSFNLKNNDDIGKKMMTGIGQSDTMVSPLHMALIVSAIANDGLLKKPKLVSRIDNMYDEIVKNFSDSTYGNLMDKYEARYLKKLMKGVILHGTGRELKRLKFYKYLYGKTGTAEYSLKDKRKSHSWFVGFYDNSIDKVVVSICVENYDNRPSARAILIAKDIFKKCNSILKC